MTEKEKIKQYLETKGVSKNKFYLKTGLSVGFLDSGNTLGVDKLRIIINSYPDINLDWLMFDRGSMVVDLVEETEIGKSSNEELLALYRENMALRQEIERLKKESTGEDREKKTKEIVRDREDLKELVKRVVQYPDMGEYEGLYSDEDFRELLELRKNKQK